MTENAKKREECIGANLPAGFIERNGLIDPTTIDEEDEVPVAPAPTASAREWLNELLMCVGEAWSDYGFNGDIYRHVWTDRKKAEEILEAYASSQSSKLAGVGQQAAEEIANLVDGALQGEEIELNRTMLAAIIDRVIAGRVK